MSRASELIDELAALIQPETKGVCDWCGTDTTKKKNAKIYPCDWSRGGHEKTVSICTYCWQAARKSWIGLPITNPEHPRFGCGISNIDTFFIRDRGVLEIDDDIRLAELMVKRMQKRLKMEVSHEAA